MFAALVTVPVTAIVTLPVALDTEILLPAILLKTPVLVIVVPVTLIPAPPEYVPAPENWTQTWPEKEDR